jgi:hypothetical protein
MDNIEFFLFLKQLKGSFSFFLGCLYRGTQTTNADSEGRPFTDEDWEQVNKIIGYQEGKPSMVVPGEDPPNMLHTVVEVRMNHNATKLLSANSTTILELSSEDLNCGIKLYPIAKSFDVKLASYKISCPEGLLGEVRGFPFDILLNRTNNSITLVLLMLLSSELLNQMMSSLC